MAVVGVVAAVVVVVFDAVVGVVEPVLAAVLLKDYQFYILLT